MNADVLQNLAIQFVDLVLKHKDRWSEIIGLPENELFTLFSIMKTVGFEITEVKQGKIFGNYQDQDGNTGEKYPINEISPFKAVNNGDNHFPATKWLDNMFSFVIFSNGKPRGEYVQLVERVLENAKKSIHMEPILLTREGDLMREYPYDNLFKHTNDSDKLSSCIGVHKICNGFMDRKSTTETHDVILCRSCHLRIPFPNTIQTYGELRLFFGVKLNK